MGDYRCQRLCKYNYGSWCPTCEKESPRFRSKSESYEPCRRRGREMKSLTPRRFGKRQEVRLIVVLALSHFCFKPPHFMLYDVTAEGARQFKLTLTKLGR